MEEARQQGATDIDIHDTVLIAAAFCMYNRYVDGWILGNHAVTQCMSRWVSEWRKRDMPDKQSQTRLAISFLKQEANSDSCGGKARV